MMKYSRKVLAACLLTLSAGRAYAETPAERLQVRAAEEAAREDLRGQVTNLAAARQTPASAEALDRAIAPAEQLGGPRWINQSMCQVKLRLAGARVGEALARDGQIDEFWAGRAFVATGASVPAEQIASLIPTGLPAVWQSIPDAARTAAVLKARDAAAQAIVDQLGGAITPADATQAVPQVGEGQKAIQIDSTATRDELLAFVRKFPVTLVTMRDDAQVEVVLYVDRDGLSEHLGANERPAAFNTIDRLPPTIAGRAKPDEKMLAANPANGRLTFPDRLPRWLREPLVAQDVAPFEASKLRTRLLAENAAVKTLRERLGKLAFDDKRTLAEAATLDNRYAAALDRVAERARVFKVDFREDGSVAVSVTIDANELWLELSNVR